MSIALGTTVKDTITGFTGVISGRAEYISGCSQCLVASKVDVTGAFRESQWFDEQRLTPQDAPLVKLDNGDTPGPDKAAPKR